MLTYFETFETSEVVGNITSAVPGYVLVTCVAGVSVQADVFISEALGHRTLM